MPGCAIKVCHNRSSTSSMHRDGITFHLFPKNPKKKEKWVKVCGQKAYWSPTKTSTICSRHFTNDCFDVSQNKRRRLFEFAVPTLYLQEGLVAGPTTPHPNQVEPSPAPSSFIKCTCPNAQVVGTRMRKLEIVAKHQKKKIKHLQYRTRKLQRKAEVEEEKLKILKKHFAIGEEEFQSLTKHVNNNDETAKLDDNSDSDGENDPLSKAITQVKDDAKDNNVAHLKAEESDSDDPLVKATRMEVCNSFKEYIDVTEDPLFYTVPLDKIKTE